MSPVEEQKRVGVGAVEVSNSFMYIPTDLIPKLLKKLETCTDLQNDVKTCREYLWSIYGSSDKVPPFDPDSFKEICCSAGTNKLFSVVLVTMSLPNQSLQRHAQNEKKAVTIIFMLMFGQSQKACWLQKEISNVTVGKGVSERGLSVLNKSGIANIKIYSVSCPLQQSQNT